MRERFLGVAIGVACIFLGSCSTIVKGTKQQVFVNTPGVPGAMCTLQSPAIGTRTVKTPGTIKLPKSRHDIAVNCTAQCHKGTGMIGSGTELMTAGNILTGGVIGLGVDAASGAMNKYEKGVEVTMSRIPGCGGSPRRGPAVSSLQDPSSRG